MMNVLMHLVGLIAGNETTSSEQKERISKQLLRSLYLLRVILRNPMGKDSSSETTETRMSDAVSLVSSLKQRLWTVHVLSEGASVWSTPIVLHHLSGGTILSNLLLYIFHLLPLFTLASANGVFRPHDFLKAYPNPRCPAGSVRFRLLPETFFQLGFTCHTRPCARVQHSESLKPLSPRLPLFSTDFWNWM